MPVVPASRHYGGPGLGEGIWRCPSCGADNAGPLALGCPACGAGRPGHRADATQAPPPPPSPLPSVPPADIASDDLALRWIRQHPAATLAEAFSAGFAEGLQEARRTLRPGDLVHAEPAFDERGKLTRTLISALELFRDQVLAGSPEETRTGEWMTAAEVTAFLKTLHAQLDRELAIHA